MNFLLLAFVGWSLIDTHTNRMHKGRGIERGCLPVPSLFPLVGSCHCHHYHLDGLEWCY